VTGPNLRPLLIAIAAIVALGSALGSMPAAAADLFVKAKPAVFVDPWAGFYFGFHVGHGWSKKTYIDNFPTYDGEVDADVGANGWLGGAQVGYNFQFQNLLVGVEGDFSWSGMQNQDFACYPFGDQLCTAKPQLFADIAGRLGYIQGPWLIYAKGGVAFVQDRYENYATCAGTQPTSRGGVSADCGVKFFADTARAGWLVGGGVEMLIDRNWSAKLEYNYMDFGGVSVTFKDGDDGFFTEEIHQKVHIVKVGLNYHFGAPGPAPSGALGYAAAGNTTGNGNGDDNNGTNRVVGFAGADGSKDNYSVFAGGLIAPFGDLDTSGLRVYMLGEGGYYRYPTDTGRISGTTTAGSLLGGWAFEGDTYSINLLTGINAINHTLSSLDLTNDVQGTAFGVMGRVDMHFNPTPQWLVTGEGDYSTAFRTYDATVKVGYEIIPNSRVYFGPEGGTNGDARSHQWRLGAHVSEIKFLGLQFDISGGYVDDSDNGPGAYGHIEMSRTF